VTSANKNRGIHTNPKKSDVVTLAEEDGRIMFEEKQFLKRGSHLKGDSTFLSEYY
jgi:hypothetical protein